jgi:hypothetical protein
MRPLADNKLIVAEGYVATKKDVGYLVVYPPPARLTAAFEAPRAAGHRP